MKKRIWSSLAIVVTLGTLIMSGQFSPVIAKEPSILEFDSMVGVTQAFTGAQNPIRGINGGGLPWVIGSGQGELKASGELEINVQGLVLAAGANTGSNPVANFRAIVSCLTSNGGVVNVSTGLFPATTGPASLGGGDAKIEATLSLPQPCIAPLVFVTNPGGSWFATIGN